MRGENRGGEQCFGYINFLHTFNRDYFFAKFSHLFAKQIEAKFREIFFCIFRERTKCENKAKWSRTKKIRETIFSFRWKPSTRVICIRFPSSISNQTSFVLEFNNLFKLRSCLIRTLSLKRKCQQKSI